MVSFQRQTGILFFGLALLAQCDRPEIKQDTDDVIVSDIVAGFESAASLMNTTMANAIVKNVGQLATCSYKFDIETTTDYNDEIIVTRDDPTNTWHRTWHIFSDLNAGLDNMIKYHPLCHSKFMEILVETETDAPADDPLRHDALAQKRLVAAAKHSSLVAYNEKFLIRDTKNRQQFIDAAKPLLKQTTNPLEFGYLMSYGNGYFHMLRFSTTTPEDHASWPAFDDMRKKNAMKLSNNVDQQSPDLKLLTETIGDKSDFKHDPPAVWSTCDENAEFQPNPDADAPPVTTKLSFSLETTNPTNYFFLDIYPPGTQMFGSYHPLCRMQTLNVIAAKFTDKKTNFAVHSEYEIPAAHKLVFESSTDLLLSSSTSISAGYLLKSRGEWNGFLFYHIIVGFESETAKDAHGEQAKGGFPAWRASRLLAANSGSSWMKLTDQINQGRILLSVKPHHVEAAAL